MVQEVQQQGNWYQTPNEIQGIGNIRRRVKEHTQVTPEKYFYCSASWSKSATTKPDGSLWTLQQATLTINSEYGTTEFRPLSGGIRIPQTWGYEIKLTGKGGGYGTAYHYIKVWGKQYLLMTTQSSADYTTVSTILNLGRYDIVTLRAWASAPSEWGATITDTITITKL